ncbi:MAG: hypothetical protein J1E65_03980 [Lachnospiraceae bacterium]|nr:hypothetical protein [Lachnospiraceae bacterium]
MSEKATPQKEETQKIVTKYDRKVQRRKEEEARAKKEKQISRIIGIVVLVLIVGALVYSPIRKFVAARSTYITVGGHKISELEFDYYYALTSNDYLDTYGDYLSYLGLNINGSFESQAYSDTMSWKDYFDQLAVNAIIQNKALLDEAEAAGFTYDASAEYAVFAADNKEMAAEAGMTLGKFYRAAYGQYATASNIKPFVMEGYIASAYYSTVADSKAASDAEIRAYYGEHTEDYDSVDYLLIQIDAEIPEAEITTDEDGNEVTAEPTEEEIKEAMDAAKEQADEVLLVIEEEGTETVGSLRTGVPTYYRDWLFDDAREEGDTTVIEDANNHRYYVLMFERRYLDESLITANIRAIMTISDNGEAILAEWEAAGATEEAFASLVPKYSQDTYSSNSGGLYTNLNQNALGETLNNWVFDEARKAGDTVTITEQGVTYVLYYVGQGLPQWQAKISGTLLSETMSQYMLELEEKYEISDPKGRLVYLKTPEPAIEDNTASDGTAEETETE